MSHRFEWSDTNAETLPEPSVPSFSGIDDSIPIAGMSLRAECADTKSENISKLNAPFSWGNDVAAPPGARMSGIGSKRKIKNVPLNREALRERQEKENADSDVTSSISGGPMTWSMFQPEGNATTEKIGGTSAFALPLGGGKPRGKGSGSQTVFSDGRVAQASPVVTLSAGSLLHEDRTCKPCFFVTTRVGCQSGADCRYCHLYHRQKSKPRPSKGKRERYKMLLSREYEEQSRHVLASNTAPPALHSATKDQDMCTAEGAPSTVPSI